MTEADLIIDSIDELYLKHASDLSLPIATIRARLEHIVAHTAKLLEALPNEEDRDT